MSERVSPICGYGMDALNASVPEHAHPEVLTRSELLAAVVWLVGGYQHALNLADNLLRAPAVTTALPSQERAMIADAIAQRREELSVVRVGVASLLDESVHLRLVSDRRRAKAPVMIEGANVLGPTNASTTTPPGTVNAWRILDPLR